MSALWYAENEEPDADQASGVVIILLSESS